MTVIKIINFNNLENWLSKYIDLNASNPSIIYIGGGTYCFSVNNNNNNGNDGNNGNDSNKYWGYEENQQFPPFLHDFKSSNINIPILIILIDPAFNLNTPPYIVNSQDQFYSNSWKKSNEYSNIYHSTLGIDVIVMPERVMWGDKLQMDSETYNFSNLMVNLTNKIEKTNTLLFYHEFTGSNVLMLEHEVKKNATTFNPNKICIDITRGSDMSCYFNLSNPEFYPVISLDETNKLKYFNPDILSNNEKINIITRYKKFTDGFEIPDSNCEYNKLKPNYLFSTNPDIILCFQIIKLDKIIFKLISNGLIPMIRYLYVCENYSNINNKMWGVSHLTTLNYCVNNFNSIINSDYKNQIHIYEEIEKIQEDLNLIELMNLNINSNPDYKESVSHLKDNIIYGLFNVIKNILVNIVIKYQINTIVVKDFINNLKQLKNKYDMITLYKNFISSLNI